jgi:hypothetical protein
MHHGLHLDPVGMPKRMRAEFTFSLKKIAIGTSVVCRCQKWSHRATIACREQAGTPMRSAGASLHQAVIYRRINRLRRSSQCGLSAPAGRPLPRFGRRFKLLPVSPPDHSNHHQTPCCWDGGVAGLQQAERNLTTLTIARFNSELEIHGKRAGAPGRVRAYQP